MLIFIIFYLSDRICHYLSRLVSRFVMAHFILYILKNKYTSLIKDNPGSTHEISLNSEHFDKEIIIPSGF